MEGCAECRALFADMAELHSAWLPEHPQFEVPADAAFDDRLRKAILDRAAAGGARFSRAAQNSSRPKPAGPMVWIGAMAAMLLLGVAIDVPLRHWLSPAQPSPQAPRPVEAAAAAMHPGSSPSVPDPNLAADFIAKMRALETFRGELEDSLAKTRGIETQLQQELAAQQEKAGSLERAGVSDAQTIAQLREQLDAAVAAEKKAATELASVKSAQVANDAQFVAQAYEIQDLRGKLREQAGSLDRERQLLAAGREIRDLIAARNLHIIDVYDTDARGKTSRAFGRVFYTEGKSLVFYGYDLDSIEAESSKVAFYLWGKRDGEPRDIHNLGALSRDDKMQRRWVLTITDPKVVAEIDSVFVTLENSEKPGKHPSGKRVLSAFLGSPANHP
jgi:hypothetical protein